VEDVNWFDSLPPADTSVPCGNGTHTLRWEAGRLVLAAHPDIEAELVLGALGGDKPACLTLSEIWSGHADDLAVLTAGPRSLADRVTVTWDQVAEQRSHSTGTGPSGGTAAGPSGGTVRATAGGPHTMQHVTHVPSGGFRVAGPGIRPGPGRPPTSGPLTSGHRTGPLADKLARRARERFEMLELMALGTALQFRLSGAVAAAWGAPERARDRAERVPELTAALSGRFAPAAADWLGIDPDAVTITPHEGPGWGRLSLTGAGGGQRLTGSLRLSWLADVWACGLAVVAGHLVVAVEQAGYPRARVRALRSPGSEPVIRGLEALLPGDGAMTGGVDGDSALPRWQNRLCVRPIPWGPRSRAGRSCRACRRHGRNSRCRDGTGPRKARQRTARRRPARQ
jgi:hypothetical protein